LFKLVERGDIRPSERAVIISTAHGLKFTSFKVGYHERSLQGIIPRYDNPPIKLPANTQKVRQTIAYELEQRWT
jgi:threonine synthase